MLKDVYQISSNIYIDGPLIGYTRNGNRLQQKAYWKNLMMPHMKINV